MDQQQAETVSIPVEEYGRLREAESQAIHAQRDHEAAVAPIQAQTDEANAQTAKTIEDYEVASRQWAEKEAELARKYQDLETRTGDLRIRNELHDATAGLAFVSREAGELCRRLLADHIEARREADGSIAAYEKGGSRPAAEVLRERLSDPALAFFFAPTTHGGSGSNGAVFPATRQPHAPGSFDALAADFRARQGSTGFGLRPVN